MDVAAEPVQQEQPPKPDTNVDAPLYFKLKTTLEVIFVSGWGEFITQYQFNDLNGRGFSSPPIEALTSAC